MNGKKANMSEKMTTYQFTTSWTGFSEITIEAENEDEARNKFYEGDYDPSDEKMTGNGLDCGFNDEKIIETKIIKEEKAND